MHYFLLLSTATVLTEIYLLFYVSNSIGLLNLMLIMLGSAIVGIIALRLNGFLTLNKVKQQLSQGDISAKPLLEGFIICIASILLIIPGLCSDLIGILCITPPLRSYIANKILKKIPVMSLNPTNEKSGDTIEGTFTEHPAENKRLK